MALGLISRAQGRAARVRVAVEGALSDGRSKKAFDHALGALQSECKSLTEHRPADGALTYAELAGSIAALAARIHAHKPRRPAGCRGYPQPEHLTAAFSSAYAPGEDWS